MEIDERKVHSSQKNDETLKWKMVLERSYTPLTPTIFHWNSLKATFCAEPLDFNEIERDFHVVFCLLWLLVQLFCIKYSQGGYQNIVSFCEWIFQSLRTFTGTADRTDSTGYGMDLTVCYLLFSLKKVLEM